LQPESFYHPLKCYHCDILYIIVNEKDAYTYLDLAIKASPESIDFKGYLDPSDVDANLFLVDSYGLLKSQAYHDFNMKLSAK